MQICYINIKIMVFYLRNVSPNYNFMKNVSPTKKGLRTTVISNQWKFPNLNIFYTSLNIQFSSVLRNHSKSVKPELTTT
jgi:hypothetical protein